MRSPTTTATRPRKGARIGAALAAAGGLVAATLGVAPASAAPGDADATGLRLALSAALGGQELISLDESLATSTAPAGGGTDRDEVIGLPIDTDLLGLDVEVISSSATRDADASSAEAGVARVQLRLADVEVVDADVLTAEAVCPREGTPSATAELASLQLLDENVDLAADAPGDVEVPLDLDIPDVLDVTALVEVRQVERTDATSAQATALIIDIGLEATLADQELVQLDVGEIVLADASCERPAGADDGVDGTDADGTDADGTDADGTDAGADADGTDAGDTLGQRVDAADAAATTALADGTAAGDRLPATGPTQLPTALATALLLLTSGALLLARRHGLARAG